MAPSSRNFNYIDNFLIGSPTAPFKDATEYKAKYIQDRVNYSVLQAQHTVNKNVRDHSYDKVSPYNASNVFTGPNYNPDQNYNNAQNYDRKEQTDVIKMPQISVKEQPPTPINQNQYSTLDPSLPENQIPLPAPAQKEMKNEEIQKTQDVKRTDRSSETDEIARQNYGPPHYQELSSMYSPIRTKQQIGMFLPSQYEDQREVSKRKLTNFKKSIQQMEKIREITKKVNK